MKHNVTRDKSGFVMIATLLMLTVLLSLVSAYYVLSNIELAATRYSKDTTTAFYAAEAGLNTRAEIIRQTFIGFNVPQGDSPDASNPCEGSNQGSGDFQCITYDIGDYEVVTYLLEHEPVSLTIPPGELYQNLHAQEFRYTARSVAIAKDGRKESILELRFKSRLVPLFQFAAFYNKDLEILPGPAMTLAGPVHTNGDLYLNSENSLTINGQVSTAGELYRGRKNTNVCNAKPVAIFDPVNAISLKPSCSTRILISESDLVPYNGMIDRDVDIVTVPEPEVFNPTPGQVYWDKADLRIVLALNSSNAPDTSYSTTGVQVRTSDDTVDVTVTNALHACTGAISGKPIGSTNSFYSNREGKTMRFLEIDMLGLLNCIHNSSLFGMSKNLADDSEGGIVFHVTVKGPNSSASANNYGVRVRNATELQSNVGGAPEVKGLTIVSDQAVFTYGHFNMTDKIPAAILADSLNMLSSAWLDSNSTNWSARTPVNTTVYSAILAGTDTTGNIEGAGGQGGAYNGGLENYPRFHEDWAKSPQKTLTYLGSFVSLNKPQHVNGAWLYGSPQYTAPIRNWGYDTDFNNAENLPPITPRFVYLRQELFVRDFEQQQ